MTKKSKSTTLGYKEDHASSGLDAFLPEIECDARGAIPVTAPRFEEESPLIAEDLRLDDQRAVKFAGEDVRDLIRESIAWWDQELGAVEGT